MFLCPCCGQAADVAEPFQGLLVCSMKGLARTLTGYCMGIELATPAPRMCSLTTAHLFCFLNKHSVCVFSQTGDIKMFMVFRKSAAAIQIKTDT